MLGCDLERAQETRLSTVGSETTRVRVLELRGCVGSYELKLPVAFAEHDDVPHLLGWKDFFDRVGVDFDPVSRSTWLHRSGFDSLTTQAWEQVAGAFGRIADTASALRNDSAVDQVVYQFLSLASKQLNSMELALRVSLRTAAVGYLRALLELWLEIEYLLEDESEASTRARRFLDYDKLHRFKLLDRLPNVKAETPQEEINRLQEDYSLVKEQFTGKRGRPSHWYPQPSLADLAGKLGRTDDYDLIYRLSSEVVHGRQNYLDNPEFLIFRALRYASRILLKVADYFGVKDNLDEIEELAADPDV